MFEPQAENFDEPGAVENPPRVNNNGGGACEGTIWLRNNEEVCSQLLKTNVNDSCLNFQNDLFGLENDEGSSSQMAASTSQFETKWMNAVVGVGASGLTIIFGLKLEDGDNHQAIQQSILSINENLDEGPQSCEVLETDQSPSGQDQHDHVHGVVVPVTTSEHGAKYTFELPPKFGEGTATTSQLDVVLVPPKLKDVSNRKLNLCPICERPYYGKKAPRRHIWTHYSEEDKKEALERGENVPSCFEKGFKCGQCPSAYTTNSELLKHQKQVHEEVVLRHVCGECGTSVKNLAGHMRQSHPKEEDFRFVCTMCEAKFINSARLKQHKLSRHGEGKMVKCERCGKLFKTRRELTVHVNSVHLKIKPYKCSHCGMAFSRKMSLTRHIQGVHEGRKQKQSLKQRRRVTSAK